MFNKRWKKILLWTLSILVVLGVGGLFAANYAVDKLMNSMADSFDPESEETAAGHETQGTLPANTDNSVDVVPVASAAPTTSNTEVVGDTAPSASSKPTEVKPSDEVDKSTDGYTAQVSTDKAKNIKENVTIKEKADVASIIMGQLSVSDINRLKDLASGGLTLVEKREARSIILGKVSEEQYNELSQIAKKYGVSQGKTRDQIIAEEERLKAQEKGSE